jgi:hypothetical protein
MTYTHSTHEYASYCQDQLYPSKLIPKWMTGADRSEFPVDEEGAWIRRTKSQLLREVLPA